MYTIPHSRPYVNLEDSNAVAMQVMTGMHATGAKTEEFEKKMCSFIGMKYGKAINSGANALFISLKALGVGKGDEVVIPSYVCQSLMHAVYRCGARPVLVDITRNFIQKGFNINAENIQGAINGKTKAIIVPHMFGVPAEIDEIIKLGVGVIEDSAQGLGAEYKGKKAGSFGVISVFSFYATKIISTGQGGMIMANKIELKNKIDDLMKYDERDSYNIAFNYGLTDLQSALGIRQLEKLGMFIDRRREIGKRYDSAFSEKFEIMKIDEGAFPFRYLVMFNSMEERDKMQMRLKEKGISCAKPVFKPLHRYLGLNGENFKNTEDAHSKVLSIPCYPALTDEEVEYVVGSILDAV